MKKDKLSLMTFSMDVDVMLKKMSVRDCLLLAKNEGIPYVDVMNASEDRLAEYVHALGETGCKVMCYIGSTSFFSKDESEIVQELEYHLNNASALNATLFMIVPVHVKKDARICARMGKEAVRHNLKKYFGIAVDLAAESGLNVCFETTPQDYACLSGIEDCRWILDQVSQLGLVYDTANMLPHGDDPLEYYEALKDRIVHTHLKDVVLSKATWKDHLFHAELTKDKRTMKCCISGQGDIPLREILHHMELDGYRGSFALEYCHPDSYPADYEQNEQQLKMHIQHLRTNSPL